MQYDPHITVVIPAYNEEKNLPHALESLSKQTYKNFDVIVADNNSTDSTPQIIKEHKAQRVLVTQKGYVFALDSGMRQASGEIISVTDADTRVSSDWLEEIARVFSDSQVVGLTGSIAIQDKSLFSKLLDLLYGGFLLIHFSIGKPHLIGFNFAVRKEAFLKAGGLDKKYTMSPDVDLGLRLKKYGKLVFAKKVKIVPSMRRWEDSASKAFIEYAKGYFYALWFRKPPPVTQTIIRD